MCAKYYIIYHWIFLPHKIACIRSTTHCGDKATLLGRYAALLELYALCGAPVVPQ